MQELSLAEKTLTYWELSRVWQGQSNKLVPTEQAIMITAEVLSALAPTRPLAIRMAAIQNEIIHRQAPLPGDVTELSILNKL